MNTWQSFATHWPTIRKTVNGMDPNAEATCAVLVTNNLNARNAAGSMSHVWWAVPHRVEQSGKHADKGSVMGWVESGGSVYNLTHFMEIREVSEPDVTPSIHVVEYGDTLSSIAQRYGVSVALLLQRNMIADPEMIYIGAKLRIR